MKRLILVSLVVLFSIQIFAETININTSEQNYSFELMEVLGISFSETALMLETSEQIYDFLFSEILYMDFADLTDAGDNELVPGFTSLLKQNYPNPFNPNTNISFLLESPAKVDIKVFNIKGQKIRTLVDGYYDTGEYTINWNGKNDDNRDEPSGVYFYKMRAKNNDQIKKMILLR